MAALSGTPARLVLEWALTAPPMARSGSPNGSGARIIMSPSTLLCLRRCNVPWGSKLEDLPNPGGDLTYPLQFSPGALINTAGRGNDVVRGRIEYGALEFNGLPALSKGCIVDGLGPKDPLPNLNSGLCTN